MLARSLLALAPLLAASALGCHKPDITAELDTYKVLFDSIEFNQCSCPEVLGFDTIEECEAVHDGITPTERQCLDDVLSDHGADAEDFLSCANEALSNYEQCVIGNINCEVDTNDVCTSMYTVALSQCTQVPSNVKAAATACTS